MLRTMSSLLLIALACAPARRYHSGAASGETIVRQIEHRSGGRDEVFVLNASAQVIHVKSLRLVGCVNVETPCGATEARAVRVAPGQRKRLAIVRQADRSRPFAYTVDWTWHVGAGR